MKSLLSPFHQQATGPIISPHQVHTPSSLLHFGKRGWWASSIQGEKERKDSHSKENIRNFSPSRTSPLCTLLKAHTLPASLTLALTLACHRHLQTPTPSPSRKLWRYRAGYGFAQSSPPGIRSGGVGWPEAMEGPKLPSQEEAGLTRSQGLGCTAERPEASLPHLSGGGKPGTPETQWEGEKRAAKRTPHSPLSCSCP